MKSTIVISMLLLLCKFAGAQSAAADFEAVRKNMLESEMMALDVDVRVFATTSEKEGKSMGKGMLRKHGKSYYSRFLENEMISNGSKTLLVDHNSKQMKCFSNSNNAAQDIAGVMKMDSVLLACDTVYLVSTAGHLRTYRMVQKRSDYSAVDVTLNTKLKIFQKITYHYKESGPNADYGANRMEVTYLNFRKAGLGNEWFDLNKFVVSGTNKSELTPTSAYRNYSITTASTPKQ